MAIIGYDNNRQAFLIQNSWGDWWGDGGRCWVPFDHFYALGGAGNGWCYEAHAIVATTGNRTQHRLTMEPIGSYFFLPNRSLINAQNGQIVRPAGSFAAAEATRYYLYGLRPDGGIEGLVDNSRWFDITSGQFPAGFSGGSAKMIATTDELLYAITKAGSVLVRLPNRLSHNGRAHWHRINLPSGEQPVDLRIVDGEVSVASRDGDVFRWVQAGQPGAGTWAKKN